ncbi:MAG: NUDIX domain-containing protein, partial [Candidatus Aenigmatarchaeota archaeon]
MKTVDYVVSGYIFKEDKVLLVYHKKLKKWLPPGGHIKKNENPIEALVREVYEETNFQISVCHNFCSFKKGDVLILPSPHHIQWEKIDKEHFHVDLVYLCQIEKEGSLKKGVKFINLNDLKNKKDIPKDVIYFAHYFYKIHLNKTGINDIKLPIMSYLVEKEKSSYFSSIKLFVIQHIKKNTIKF